MEGVGGVRAFEEGIHVKSPAPPTPDHPTPLSTASEAVAWVASALRLADVRSGSGAFSEATAKRVAGANAQVSPEKTAALLEQVIDALFNNRYLRARGLDEGEAEDHRRVLLTGVEGALLVWDRLAALANNGDPRGHRAAMQVLCMALLGDIAARMAAYLVRYGRAFPALRRFAEPEGAVSIAEALRQIRARSRAKISEGALLGASNVDRNTLRDLRNGVRLPREETILALARGLATFRIAEAEGDATAAEIEVELRLACLVKSLRDALADNRDLRDGVADETEIFRFYASDLRRYGPCELAEIVAQGTQWPRWNAEVHARLSQVLHGQVFQMADAIKADADLRTEEVLRRSADDPKAPLRSMADFFQTLARQTRDGFDGIPDWERSCAGDMVQFFDDATRLMNDLVEGREPTYERRFGDTARARALCAEAIAPWNAFSREQREQRFNQAVELDPACAYVRHEYATFLMATEAGLAEAERHLDVAVMLDDTYNRARQHLVDVLVRRGKFQEALGHIDALEARLGATPQVLTSRGNVLLGLGQATAAIEMFSRALGLAPRNVAAHVGMANALRASGDSAGARRHEQAAELHAGVRSPRPTAIRR